MMSELEWANMKDNVESYLENTAWKDFIEIATPKNSEYSRKEIERYKEDLEVVYNINGNLYDEGFKSIIIVPESDHKFSVRPSFEFYDENPKCFGYGTWSQNIVKYDEVGQAVNSIYGGSLPNIDQIDAGWKGMRSPATVKSCNEKWHIMVQEELSDSIMQMVEKEDPALAMMIKTF